jgi:hypothetical protein
LNLKCSNLKQCCCKRIEWKTITWYPFAIQAPLVVMHTYTTKCLLNIPTKYSNGDINLQNHTQIQYHHKNYCIVQF